MKKYMLFLAMIAFFASCSKDKKESPQSKVELGVNASISGSVSVNSMKSLISDFSGKTISLYLIGDITKGTSYDERNLGNYNKSGSIWLPPTISPNKLWLSTEVGIVYGFFPAGIEASFAASDTTIAISVSGGYDFTSTSQMDYMYATDKGKTTQATASTANPIVDLDFHHALAKVTFIINKGTYPHDAAGILTQLKLTEATAAFPTGSAGKMSLINGKLSNLTMVTTITANGNDTINEVNAATYPAIVQLLVAPSAKVGTPKLDITLDSKPLSVVLPTLLTPLKGWEAGKNYIYTITVDGQELTVTSVTIIDWINVDVGTSTVIMN